MEYTRQSRWLLLILLALALLLLPLQWVVGWMMAAAIHEAGHWLATVLCGGEVSAFRCKTWGAEMICAELSAWKQILCSLSGPICSMLLILLYNKNPALALCGFLQGVFNLIPIYPLDGSIALRAFIRLVLPPRFTESVIEWVEFSIFWGLVLVVTHILLQNKGGSLLFVLLSCLFLKKYSLQTGPEKSTIALP